MTMTEQTNGNAAYLSPTYLLTSVPAFLESVTYRMLADGMTLHDVAAARAGVEDWAQWGPFFVQRAKYHERLATDALKAASTLTAEEHYVHASLAAHYAQFLYFDFPDVKREAQALKVDLYEKAAQLMGGTMQRVEVPFRSTTLPGYLRMPVRIDRPPLAVIVGGLDAAKEDMHQFAGLCLARGLATLVFDGPGQGETLYRGLPFSNAFHEAVSMVIDAAIDLRVIDEQRIGIVGRSLGGFLAPQAAALDSRIRACVAWGALYDLGSFDRKPPLIRSGYRFVTASSSLDEAKEKTRFVTMQGLAARIRCPLLILHGERDNSVPVADAQRLASEAAGPVELKIIPNSIHCCHDASYYVRPFMADWMAAALRAETPGR